MKGFDSKYEDFPDYILGVTREVWERRGVSTLRDFYAPDIVVRSPASLVVGNESVIAATMATQAEFPDRELLGEDVIWCGSPEEGMLSSHRILSTATHSGNGAYGSATGRKLRYRAIADCHARDNTIDDEWLIRDQGAIVRQLGWEPADYARHLIESEGGPQRCIRPFAPEFDRSGPYSGNGNANQWGARYADILRRIMDADMAAIPAEYDRACQLEYPAGAGGSSHDFAIRFWMEVRSSIPSAAFDIDHRIGREDPLMPPRAAVRWSLRGRHDGWGRFGAPTGADIYLMGVSHAEFGPWGLRREYVLFDEVAVWKQILLQTGQVPDAADSRELVAGDGEPARGADSRESVGGDADTAEGLH